MPAQSRDPSFLNCKCQNCGALFYRKPSHVAQGFNKFCSKDCRYSIEAQVRHFWERVNKTDSCWLWTGPINDDSGGHGAMIRFRGRFILPHRLSWELTHGPIPDGLCVLHNCPGGDVPHCVRPDHLYLGTHRDNMRDASEKGQFPCRKGELHHESKLTNAQAEEIRQLAADFSLRKLAIRFNVSKPTIWKIVKRRSYLTSEPEPQPRCQGWSQTLLEL